MPREGQRDVLPATTSAPASSPVLIPSNLSSRRESCRKTIVALIDEFPLRRASTLNLLRREESG